MYQHIAVIGSGSIGPDLAYGFAGVMAECGGTLFLHDISSSQLEQGMARIRGYIEKGVARGKFSPKKGERILAAIKPTTVLADLAPCGYVLEAATENLRVKHTILSQLEQVVAKDCLIGFATSGIPRAQIVAPVKHPERCFVNHPFYPAWRSLPIELVPSHDLAYSRKMYELLKFLGKVPILTADVPCFAADDVFCNFECEAFRIVEEGLASVWQVDRIINEHIGGGGPCLVADLTNGNNLIIHCQELMAQGKDGSPWFNPPKILREKANSKWHEHKGDSQFDQETETKVMDRILAVLFSRALYIVENGICTAGDLDWMLRNALGFKVGILSLAQTMGIEHVRRICVSYAEAHPGYYLPDCLKNGALPSFMANLHVEKDEITTVLVRRPEVINALNADTLSELKQVLTALDKDPQVKGIIFGGFSGGLAGADISELAALDNPSACEATCAKGHELTRLMEHLSKPIVAAVDGPVLGGGAELCMAAWARVVSPKAIIGQPEVNLGIIPGYGGTQRLPRLIGQARALTMLRTGMTINAEQACAWGWAHGQPADNPFMEARRLIQDHLAGKVQLTPLNPNPLALEPIAFGDIGHRSWCIDHILRHVFSKGIIMPLDQGLQLEAEGFGRCRLTRDMAIGMANFSQNGPRVPAVFVHA